MVFIDHGGSDSTFAILGDAARVDPRISLIAPSRNFGHQATLSTALDHVSADVVIISRRRSQDPPETQYSASRFTAVALL